MPPRYSYWTILADGLPTAFRATDREELEPTFRRLRERHPDAVMKWFARGKLWDSPDAARADRERERGSGRAPAGDRGPRGRDWRPGGEHRDPRQKFKDAKKARNVDRRREKFARKQGGAQGGAPRPEGAKRFEQAPRDRWRDSAPREKPHGDKLRARTDRGFDDRRSFRPPGGGTRPEQRGRDQGRGGEWRPDDARGNRPRRDQPPRDLPPRDEQRNRQRRDEEGRRDERGRQERPSGFRPDWRARPPRGKSHGHTFRPNTGGQERPGPRDRPAPHGPRERDDRRDQRPRPPLNEWRREGPPGDRPPRDKPHGDPLRPGARPFDRKRFPRGQGTEEPPQPARPRGPNREPRPDEIPEPTPPPRPTEPITVPPGPPERGRLRPRRRS